MSGTSIRNAAVSMGLIALMGGTIFFLFQSDYYDVTEAEDSAVVGAYGLEDAQSYREDDAVRGEDEAPATGVEDAVVLAQVDDDAWLVDLDAAAPDRVLVVTDRVDMPTVRQGDMLSADGRMTTFDRAALSARGVAVEQLHDAYEPGAVLWAENVEVDD